MVRLTAEELGLIVAYRRCCDKHKRSLRWFSNAAASCCVEHTPENVVILTPIKVG